MSSLNLVRRGGVAAMVGGALFVVLTLVMASMPRGCIGAECAFRGVGTPGSPVVPC
ncbi:MAG: hypothetical protein M3324_06180 [Actinomycetota bacterium]|nr:hypothetical protein [Actinomycetota bacterium]